MPSIRYLGPTSDDIDVLTRLRLQEEIVGNLTSDQVQAQVLDSLTNKANAYYLGDASSQRVGPSAISGKGSTLIKKSSYGQANSTLPIANTAGRISPSYMPNAHNRPGGRGWNRATEYTHNNMQIITGHYASLNDQQIGSFTVQGPSHAWFPMFLGNFQIGLGKGEVLIKRGGNIVARAVGGNDPNMWFSCQLVPMFFPGSVTGNQTFTVHRKAVFSPGSMNLGTTFRITCISVPM